MVCIRRFLNTSTKLHLRYIFMFCLGFILSGCAKSSGDSNLAQKPDSPLACPFQTSPLLIQNLSERNGLEVTPASESSINFDPHYDSFIVGFSEDPNKSALMPSGKPLKDYNVAGVRLSQIGDRTYTMKLGNSESRSEILKRLMQERHIEYLEPDYPITQNNDISEESIFKPREDDDVINDSMFMMSLTSQIAQQWAIANIELPQAWQVTRGAQDLVVAVIDSGIDYNHNDLKNNIWQNTSEIANNGRDDDRNGFVDDIRGWNFVNNNNNPTTTSQSNHGTHVAGIIGASGSALGVSQNVRLMPLRFIDESGNGSTSNAIRAIDYAIQKGAFAINNSWGSPYKSLALQAAIQRAEKAGVLFVVAAGNGDNGKGYNISTRPYYPASFTNANIIRVAASTSQNILTRFSNFSQKLVDVAAPGYGIISTVTGNRYMKMSGTSMATPFVTGLAVLVKAANRNLDASQIRAVIAATVDPISNLKPLIQSGGRVNARKAVQMAVQVGPEFVCP